MSDKVSVVGDKLKELQNADLGEVAENAKDYARKNPGSGHSDFGGCGTGARADPSRQTSVNFLDA